MKGIHMENTKIGNKEAIALLVTIAFNHIIINSTKAIIDVTASASLLNILYIGIITIIFTSIICYFLNKFPTLDVSDKVSYVVESPGTYTFTFDELFQNIRLAFVTFSFSITAVSKLTHP